ncbi:MAG: hydroxymethylglutaryl-CoA reductase, degradative, partial [Myxococcota bacterium]|nr:hydroxymethylglutaryl-CoA reductase, degradative [Myxococcota bacterium]
MDRLIPMVIEEASVVAAASHAAKLLRSDVGIETRATAALMIGQIQICDVPDLDVACEALEALGPALVESANDNAPRLVARGGGARGFEVRRFEETAIGPMVVAHLLVDVCDAMGANLVNGMCEALAPRCEEATGGQAFLKILSNLADRRLVHATGRVPLTRLARPALGLTGAEVADRIVRASVFAEVDPYRAATHNKGIMNGVDAFLLATGQDWRAVEAGAHAHAASTGTYTAMATWRVDEDALVGRITLPMQVGVVGGIVKVHPVVKVLLKVLGAETAADVGRAAAAVGLAQNLAAILALATEGIQRGHMSLHARNIAAAAGARDDQIDKVVAEMIRRRNVSTDAATTILDEDQPKSAAPLTLRTVIRARDRWWPEMEAIIASIVPPGAERGTLGDLL